MVGHIFLTLKHLRYAWRWLLIEKLMLVVFSICSFPEKLSLNL